MCIALAASTFSLSVSALLAGSAYAAPPPKKQDPVQVATDYFKAGTTLYQQRNYSAALDQFQKSYNTVPSPNSGLYIARCLDNLGRHKDAYIQFRKVIVEAQARVSTEPKYAPTLDSAKNEADQAAAKIAVLSVQVRNAAPSARLVVGGTPIPREQWGQPLPFDAGTVVVTLETEGAPTVGQRVELHVGERKTIDISPNGSATGPAIITRPRRRHSSEPSVLLPLAITFGGIGVIGMGMFGVAGGLSLSTYSEVQDKCPNGPDCTDDLVDRGEKEQLIATSGSSSAASVSQRARRC